MTTLPWDVDRILTEDLARSVLKANFTDLDLGSLEHLGSGWDFDAYRTRDDWVFRFPRRAESESLFEVEGSILGLVAPRLPSGVRVPEVERIGVGRCGFPYAVAGHRFIHGAPADSIPLRLRGTMARSLGQALGAIHSVPLPAARAVGLVELNRPLAQRQAWLREGLAAVTAVARDDPLIAEALKWALALRDPLRHLDSPTRFVHQDLSPGHLLVDPETGELSGILDWTDATLGDAARDFVIVVAMGGWRLADQVLAAYPLPVDKGFIDRLDFMARLLPLMWLGHAHRRGEDLSRHRSWVAHAFARPSP